MKAIFKVAAVVASALMVFSSCVKEQTEFSIEDIPGTAKVMGVITTNEGQAYQNGRFIDLVAPAAGIDVVVKVANDGLSPTSAKGYTDYTVQTDASGYYEVVIPATDESVRIEVVAQSYTGTYSVLNRDFAFVNDMPVFTKRDVIYKFEKTAYVSAGRMAVVGGEYTREYVKEGYDKTQELVFNVFVEAAAAQLYSKEIQNGQDINLDYSYYPTTFNPLADVQLEITVEADFDGDGYTDSQVFSGVTDNSGNAAIRFNAHSSNLSDVYVTVEARDKAAYSMFNFWTWTRKDITSYDEYYRPVETFKWVQEKTSIPSDCYYYKAHNSVVSKYINFGGLTTPTVKVQMEPTLFEDLISEEDKNEEGGWYQKWNDVKYWYENNWF